MGTNKKTLGARTKFSTVRTSLRCIIRTDFNSSNSFSNSFIANELLQLGETPPMQPEVKSSAFISSDSFNVLQNNSSRFAVIDNLLAYYMIPIPHKPSLFSRDFLEQSLGTSSAFGLEFSIDSFEFQSFTLDLPCTKELFVTGYSNMIYSDINSKKTVAIRIIDVNVSGKSYMQEQPLFPVKNQVSTSCFPGKILPVIFRDFKINFNPAFNRSKSNKIFFESKTSSIISNCKQFFKSWFSGLFRFSQSFKRFTSLISAAAHQLGRKLQSFSNWIISHIMYISLKVSSIIPTNIKSILSRKRIFPHGFKKFFFVRNFQLYGSNRFHADSEAGQLYKPYARMSSAYGGEKSQFLPQLKLRVSLRQVL